MLGQRTYAGLAQKSELYKAYLEGVMWSFEYYGGEVKNYGYCYGHRERVSMHGESRRSFARRAAVAADRARMAGLLKAAPQLSRCAGCV